jgi:EAL domain-containing protein (putative c-di-GMP-specific phosphodiesterase class I)/CheY-like chemotaxis protein
MANDLSNPNRLLVVDDEPGIVAFIEEVAEDMGYAVESTDSPARFATLVGEFKPSVVMLDLQLPQADGVELLRSLSDANSQAQVLLISGMDRRILSATHELGISRGVPMLGLLPKPLMIEDLEAKLAEAFQAVCHLDGAELQRGLDAGEILPYFQPKAYLTEVGNWYLGGVEALARWEHPEMGLVMPDEFIAIAEETGKIGALTEHMLTRSLRQVREWANAGLELRCAVNLPPSLVTDLDFPDRVAALLAEYQLDGRQLILEITETAVMQEPSLTMDILTRLRVKRIGLALDDFGTGFSSLTQLYQMPFDELKIDRSLVMNIPNTREANTMVGSLIDLGHNLGLSICAEGVESRAALDLLATLGCDSCQGFFISRAVPAADIEQLVSRWNQASSVTVAQKIISS